MFARRTAAAVVAAVVSGFVEAPRPTRRARGPRANDSGPEETTPDVFDWLKARRDFFEPAWPWLTARREWSEVVKAGRRAEQARLARGKEIIEREIEKLSSADRAARRFVEDEWAREAAARESARQFVEDEWQREARLRAGAQLFLEDERRRARESAARFLEDEWRRENGLREGAQLFLNDEWDREEAARLEARAFVADEFERLADADEALAARIRGAPEITVCAAPVACGRADGRRVYERLRDLSAREVDYGRPPPLVRCATKCSSNCKAGRVAVTLGLPRNEVLHCTPAGPGCEDALGYCDPDEYEALIDANVDEQLGEILERTRRRPPLFRVKPKPGPRRPVT
ncbi:hypothetical protein SO694_00017449 [Aureococcus anophagefferens]|uniref:Uncharacterized protein n=1 Tax=Aureococcus anophagefferens TaxID=44056 RepID=A0ABR1G2Y3_AURAN